MFHLDDPHSRQHHALPQFLIISPPKTGSTWLADNLRNHPQLFVPPIKEVKYFSSLFKSLDLKWYAEHFAPAQGRLAGEASPTYASLPLESIRAIHDLMPRVKLLFLMRDPISRAWSHAKHIHKYREATFTDCTEALENVTLDQWREACSEDWMLACGDYLGQLRRWLSVFPAQQVFVGFFESIIECPSALLHEVFSFLGVEPNVSLCRFPVADRILPGPDGVIAPDLELSLRHLLGRRTEELARFLREIFALSLPPAWQHTLRTDAKIRHEPPVSCRWDFDGVDLASMMKKEGSFRTSFRQLQLDYHGFDLLFYRGRLLAVPISLGAVQELDGSRLEQHLEAKVVLTASTLDALKECVTSRLLKENAEKISVIDRDLRIAREESARIRIDLQTLVDEVRRPTPPVWKRKLRGLGRRIKRRLLDLASVWTCSS